MTNIGDAKKTGKGVCSLCGVQVKPIGDPTNVVDAEAEREILFGAPPQDDDEIVCDDCWKNKVLPECKARGIILDG